MALPLLQKIRIRCIQGNNNERFVRQIKPPMKVVKPLELVFLIIGIARSISTPNLVFSWKSKNCKNCIFLQCTTKETMRKGSLPMSRIICD